MAASAVSSTSVFAAAFSSSLFAPPLHRLQPVTSLAPTCSPHNAVPAVRRPGLVTAAAAAQCWDSDSLQPEGGGTINSNDSQHVRKRPLLGCLLLLGSVAPAAASNFWGSDLLARAAKTDSSEQYIAQDDNGKDIVAAEWVASHPAGDRTIAKGYPDGPIYLVIGKDGSLGNYGINAICTHMGCVVPWVPEEDKCMCLCHGSQYDNRGQVVQGPAPLSLALQHVDVVNGKVAISPWLETDFRDGEAPWWAE